MGDHSSIPEGRSSADAERSEQNLVELASLAARPDSRLVFFVGAGVSTGTSQFPPTRALMAGLVEEAISRSPKLRGLSPVVPDLSKVGFEMVLNDLWQICQPAVGRFIEHLRAIDEAATPSLAHAFLGEWLAAGRLVMTTNYDRLIERTWDGPVRFDREGGNDSSFATWEKDLGSGALFKLHGSLERPNSCLAALEHVGTAIAGPRRDLLLRVFTQRPLCVLGWRGADPDIPPILRTAFVDRPRDLPVFWVHRTGASARAVSPLLRGIASLRPIIGTANDVLGRLDRDPSAARRLASLAARSHRGDVPSVSFDGTCSTTGLSRFVAITVRRAGDERTALRASDVAAFEATSIGEWMAAREEHALNLWASAAGREDGQFAARRVVADVVGTLRRRGAPTAASPLFGLMSMTVSLARRHPLLIAQLPLLFRANRRAIAAARDRGEDSVGIDIQEALTDYYAGRARLLLAGRLGRQFAAVKRWVLEPYERARARVAGLPERSLHARFDVIAGRAIALARLGECDSSVAEVDELDRLALLLSDPRRVAHWDDQRATIARLCSSLV